MPHLDVHHLNFLAIGAAALAAFFLGAIWYTVLFGKAWARQHGYSDEQLKSMQAKRPMPIFFGVLIVCYFLIALALAHFVPALGATTAVGGLVVAIAAWVIVAGFRMTAHISSPKPIGAFLIDAGFDLIALIAMSMIIALWR